MSLPSEPRIEKVPAPQEGVAVLELAGELDLAVHDRFRALAAELIAEAPPVVLADVSEVEFMDSTMLREVLRCHRELEEAGSRLVVVGAQAPVRRLLELTGTDEVFALADTREDALNSE